MATDAPEADVVRLARDASAAERMAALRVFVERWHRRALHPFRPSPGDSWPRPLAEYHSIAAQVPALASAAGLHLLPRAQVHVEDERLVFCEDPQGVVEWGLERGADDPAVWLHHDEDESSPQRRWEREDERLSGWLLQLVFVETIHEARVSRWSTLEAPRLDRLLERLHPLPLGRWRWQDATLHARDGLLLFARPASSGGFVVKVTYQDVSKLDFIADLLDEPIWKESRR